MKRLTQEERPGATVPGMKQGSKVVGLDSRTGSLTPGKQADLILIDGDDLNTFPMNDPVSTAVLICNDRGLA